MTLPQCPAFEVQQTQAMDSPAGEGERGGTRCTQSLLSRLPAAKRTVPEVEPGSDGRPCPKRACHTEQPPGVHRQLQESLPATQPASEDVACTPSDFPVPRRICAGPGSWYDVVGNLGSGGFGKVVLAKHSTGPEVAVKVFKRISPAALAPAPGASYPGSCFVHEWNTLRGLGLGADVQWMPRVHECGVIVNRGAKDKDDLGLTPWYSMEALTSLDKLKSPLSKQQLAAVGRGALKALQGLHGMGMLHNDIKPENMALRGDACLAGAAGSPAAVVLLDFGLADHWKKGNAGSYRTGFLGTIQYAGVDTLRGLALGPKDDLESLANSLLELYSTKLPWVEPTIGASEDDTFHADLALERQAFWEGQETESEDLTLSKLAKWVKHCRGLPMDQPPDYPYLDSLLADLAAAADFVEPSPPAAKAAKAAAPQAPEE